MRRAPMIPVSGSHDSPDKYKYSIRAGVSYTTTRVLVAHIECLFHPSTPAISVTWTELSTVGQGGRQFDFSLVEYVDKSYIILCLGW
ncbi:hypothetical protein AG1IA_06627 [Rhizoctonia solani AG-1 IA]|uniref:Uncharacterized protein n=1 Tax=Thanatephorus cucumeris (strain AG1-IA) TaxID=983506 RepID=L8WRD9_THACA|nr:hypothetical protein AG1IA_06627 [Rhizoctonia solani AG-1 IA]